MMSFDKDIEQLYLLRFFIVDLCSCLAQEYEKMKQREANVLRAYRGVNLSDEEFEKLKENEVALHFAGESAKHRHEVGVLFEIECDLSELNDTIVVADIAHFSSFADEEEVLFDLGATFEIRVVHQTELNVCVVEMRPTGKGREIAQGYIGLNRKEMEEKSVVVMFGILLCDMGQHQTKTQP
ncbi:unnamed protein product [Didymodactylos carnosus]|uniref:Uncharacterized protein n=1 Tax=Didymodactylos carnosus TaxID=1234261 RepID=A0A8S2F5K4_9BILA|nr:unnamed protein product [Didymodactylos carnosus]CAF4141101.1 unnamed protein product [Didymodactylos carnosus]